MIAYLDHTSNEVARTINNLQKLSYAEAELIKDDSIPYLQQNLSDIKLSGEVFLGLTERNRLLGIISYKDLDNFIDIHRLVVHPRYFRKKIATRLLIYLLDRYAGRKITVAAAIKNYPAIKLYTKFGFEISGEKKPVEDNIVMVTLIKKAL